ncbi:uncharacterized protein BYT42DRAFT_156061 [Radiomyces spectabilis]|uniref:uncharacterized protein n=1 Tax=Radiomyces spectabilis TaxID=64574 RepID=UPI002220EBC9|nr:uncharacterized protein BYT42DRAFT_156061 [Radiomyces spectabilis]KAI8365196.1 hypothetical protein BYT42DRAFT_156061 [Radiomyces spectabilis]
MIMLQCFCEMKTGILGGQTVKPICFFIQYYILGQPTMIPRFILCRFIAMYRYCIILYFFFHFVALYITLWIKKTLFGNLFCLPVNLDKGIGFSGRIEEFCSLSCSSADSPARRVKAVGLACPMNPARPMARFLATMFFQAAPVRAQPVTGF